MNDANTYPLRVSSSLRYGVSTSTVESGKNSLAILESFTLAFLENIQLALTTMFRVQDECRINTKSKDIRVRYFLFSYEQLVESIWYPFYHGEVSFKRYLIELSEAYTVMVNNVERKERTRKQS